MQLLPSIGRGARLREIATARTGLLGALRNTEIALNVYVHDLQREESTRRARDEAERAVRDSERLQGAARATSLAVIDSAKRHRSPKQRPKQRR